MPQHTLYFDAVPLSDDSYEMLQFELGLEHAFDSVVNDTFFEEARKHPYIEELEVRVFFRFNACGCSFSSQPEAGFSYLTSLTVGQARLNCIHLTARDWYSGGMDKDLAWKLSVKNAFNEQIKQQLPPYHEQVPRELWTHVLIAARNALMDYILMPADTLSTDCTQEHWKQLLLLTDKLSKVTLHFSPHSIVYRCNLFTPEDANGRSYNTDVWNLASTLEVFAEEPHATFQQRNTWDDLYKFLAAAGLDSAIAEQIKDCNGKSLLSTI